MRAGDVKCQTCGSGLVDVDPDYDPTKRDPRSVMGPPKTWSVQGRCAKGHLMIYGTGKDGAEGAFTAAVYDEPARKP